VCSNVFKANNTSYVAFVFANMKISQIHLLDNIPAVASFDPKLEIFFHASIKSYFYSTKVSMRIFFWRIFLGMKNANLHIWKLINLILFFCFGMVFKVKSYWAMTAPRQNINFSMLNILAIYNAVNLSLVLKSSLGL
jgi:hypothetical protein